MTTELSNPHDRFFKAIFSRRDVARDFLSHYLPTEVISSFNLTSLETIKDTFVDHDLQTHFSDLLYKVSLHNKDSDAYIYILFEHKSYSDPLTAFQLLRYMVRIWEHTGKQHKNFSPIFPVVIYHGRTAWNIPTDFQSLFELPEALISFLPNYNYWLCDLSRYSDEEIKGDIILRVTLLLLKYIMHDDLRERLPDILSLIQNLSELQTGLEYLETVLHYLARGTDKVSEDDLQQAIDIAFTVRRCTYAYNS